MIKSTILLIATVLGASSAFGRVVLQNKVECQSVWTDTAGYVVFERNTAETNEWHLKGVSSTLILELGFPMKNGDFKVELIARDYLSSQNLTVRLYDNKSNRSMSIEGDNKVQFSYTFDVAEGVQNQIITSCFISPK